MEKTPLTIHSWPRAIMHVDADAFFASCEQAIHPELKGKPVVTGKERGIVAAASYEAKAGGVERGMSIPEARKACTGLVVMPSDYETYSLFSVRMFEILRSFSPDIEEYSIDEAFVDLTGLRRSFRGSYEQIARSAQEFIGKELDITVSAGLSITKVLAKMASKHRKPGGLTVIPGREIHLYLAQLPIEKLWGIGSKTSAFLQKFRIKTALDFARMDEGFIKRRLSKPYREVWHELNGRLMYPVDPTPKDEYKSISKVKTFTPPSKDPQFIFAQLSGNLENACIKARRYHLAASRLMALLRTQHFEDTAAEVKLNRPTAYPAEMFDPLHECFEKLYNPGVLYRSTGVVLSGLVSENEVQYSLFDDPMEAERTMKIYSTIDELSERFGKHAVQHATSLPVKSQQQHEGERGDTPQRKKELIRGENARQRLGIPLLDVDV